LIRRDTRGRKSRFVNGAEKLGNLPSSRNGKRKTGIKKGQGGELRTLN